MRNTSLLDAAALSRSAASLPASSGPNSYRRRMCTYFFVTNPSSGRFLTRDMNTLRGSDDTTGTAHSPRTNNAYSSDDPTTPNASAESNWPTASA